MGLSLLRFFTLCTLLCCVLWSSAAAENPRYRVSVTHGEILLGDIVLELFPDIAPQHVRNFDSLVAIKFYDGTAFHRVIPGFVIQGGDPNSRDKPRDTWGFGEPGQRQIPAEFNSKSHVRGILSAARLPNDPNSATSQFFICVANTVQLDGQYSIYGQVLEGMEVADAIVNVARDNRNNPLEKVEVTIVKMASTDVAPVLDTPVFAVATIPQPASDNAMIQYELAHSGMVSVGIYNQLGQELLTPIQAFQYAGENAVPIDVSGLPNGVYYIRITVGSLQTIRPIVVAR